LSAICDRSDRCNILMKMTTHHDIADETFEDTKVVIRGRKRSLNTHNPRHIALYIECQKHI
jgi:hypothetical protein